MRGPGFLRAALPRLAKPKHVERAAWPHRPSAASRPSGKLQHQPAPLCVLAARREQARCRGEVDVGNEQSLLTVGLIAQQRSVGAHHR